MPDEDKHLLDPLRELLDSQERAQRRLEKAREKDYAEKLAKIEEHAKYIEYGARTDASSFADGLSKGSGGEMSGMFTGKITASGNTSEDLDKDRQVQELLEMMRSWEGSSIEHVHFDEVAQDAVEDKQADEVVMESEGGFVMLHVTVGDKSFKLKVKPEDLDISGASNDLTI